MKGGSGGAAANGTAVMAVTAPLNCAMPLPNWQKLALVPGSPRTSRMANQIVRVMSDDRMCDLMWLIPAHDSFIRSLHCAR